MRVENIDIIKKTVKNYLLNANIYLDEIIDAINEIFEIIPFFDRIILNIENTLKGIENANA